MTAPSRSTLARQLAPAPGCIPRILSFACAKDGRPLCGLRMTCRETARRDSLYVVAGDIDRHWLAGVQSNVRNSTFISAARFRRRPKIRA